VPGDMYQHLVLTYFFCRHSTDTDLLAEHSAASLDARPHIAP
jgi:hypothetical protein